MKKLQIAVGIIRNENNEIFRVEFYSKRPDPFMLI